jgi:hypothetical protein
MKTGLPEKMTFDRGPKQSRSPMFEANCEFDAARLNKENVGG